MKNIYILIASILSFVSCSTKTEGYLGEPTEFVSNSKKISGTIIDSQTGRGLALATISLTLDQSATTGVNSQYQAISDRSGYFSINSLPPGNYNVIIELTGYFTRIVSNVEVANGQIQLTPQTLVQQPAGNSVRIVLTWGSTPNDLDSHLTGPTSDNNRFHIYYTTKTQTNAGAVLDVDDVSSYGPETVTIETLYNGTYRYSVYNYSDQGSTGGSGIASSPAKVEIYDHSGLIKSYTAPAFTGTGNTWRVFEMLVSGTNITYTQINTYVTASRSADVASFAKATNTPTNSIKKRKMSYNIIEW